MKSAEWHVWYYETPWFSIPPGDIDVVVPLGHRDIGVKKEAASQHRSQTDRTPYTELVEVQGKKNADILPELLLGHHHGRLLRAFGMYCEVYQMRLPEFYADDSGAVVVYSNNPLPYEE
ncbi:hypothetical protein ACFL09_00855 [Planctomycetota bacterium]